MRHEGNISQFKVLNDSPILTGFCGKGISKNCECSAVFESAFEALHAQRKAAYVRYAFYRGLPFWLIGVMALFGYEVMTGGDLAFRPFVDLTIAVSTLTILAAHQHNDLQYRLQQETRYHRLICAHRELERKHRDLELSPFKKFMPTSQHISKAAREAANDDSNVR